MELKSYQCSLCSSTDDQKTLVLEAERCVIDALFLMRTYELKLCWLFWVKLAVDLRYIHRLLEVRDDNLLLDLRNDTVLQVDRSPDLFILFEREIK